LATPPKTEIGQLSLDGKIEGKEEGVLELTKLSARFQELDAFPRFLALEGL
jgi:hypothetical protein